MTKRTFVSALMSAAVTAALTLVPGVASGQKTAPYNPPKTPDGQPNIQGHYAPDAPTRSTVSKKARIPKTRSVVASALRRSLPRRWKNRQVIIVDPEPGPHIPYQPAAREKQRQLLEAEVRPAQGHRHRAGGSLLTRGHSAQQLSRRHRNHSVSKPGHDALTPGTMPTGRSRSMDVSTPERPSNCSTGIQSAAGRATRWWLT